MLDTDELLDLVVKWVGKVVVIGMLLGLGWSGWEIFTYFITCSEVLAREPGTDSHF